MTSVILSLVRLNLQQRNICSPITNFISLIPVRNKSRDVDLPSNVGPQAGKYRRIVHYPEEYTVKPLNVQRLGGRDPVSGRLVVKGIGGGIKRKYQWIYWKRQGPKEGPPLVEKVIDILIDWNRTSRIALVAGKDTMKYYLATENMKPGDLIYTSGKIPRIPVAAKEGDAHPLGALEVGTKVNCVEKYPGEGGCYVKAAGAHGTIVRKVGQQVVVQLPSHLEVSLPQENMATVGRLSNVEHADTPIGSAQRNRELGNRPRSGLWKRKDGRFGRKIKPTPPLKVVKAKKEPIYEEVVRLTLNNDMYHGQKLSSFVVDSK